MGRTHRGILRVVPFSGLRRFDKIEGMERRYPKGAESHRYVFPEIIGGHYWAQPKYAIERPKGRYDWLLLLTLSGEGLVGDGKTMRRLAPGQMMLFAPGAPQFYRKHPEAKGWESLWVHFYPRTDWAPLLAWPKMVRGVGAFDSAVLPEAAQRAIRAELREAVCRTLDGTPLGDAQAVNLLERVLLRCRPVKPRPKDEHEAFAERIRELFQRNPANTEETLARQLGLSRAVCARRFRECFGMTPTVYGERYRLEQAKRMLAAGLAATVGEAAQVAGFRNASYFAKRFRGIYGVVPSTLLKETPEGRPAGAQQRGKWKMGPGTDRGPQGVTGGFCAIRPGMPYHIRRPQGRRDWLLFLTLSGEGLLGGRGIDTVRLGPGKLGLYAPGAPQDYRMTPSVGHWDFLWLHFRAPVEWGPLLTWRPMAEGLNVLDLSAFREEAQREIGVRLRAAARHARGYAPWEARLTRNLLERALLRCLLEEQNGRKEEDAFAERMQAHLFRTLHRPQTVAALARAAGLSPSRFAHRFTETFGESPLAYAERYRLERARRLLCEGICSSVKEAAFAVGFSDPLYFSRRFHRLYGVPPSRCTGDEAQGDGDPSAEQ